MRLLDINGDGCDDAIFGIAQPSASSSVNSLMQQPDYCKQYEHGCLGNAMLPATCCQFLLRLLRDSCID